MRLRCGSRWMVMNMTKLLLTPARARKLKYDRLRAAAIRAGTWDDAARANAQEQAAEAKGELERRRKVDATYRRAVRAAEKLGAPKDVALEEGRKARAKLETAFTPKALQGAQVCEFYKLTRKSAKSANYERVKVENPPAVIAAIAPRAGDTFWNKYQVAEQGQGTSWSSWLVSPRGQVKDSTIRILTHDDVVKNAHERAEMPTNSAVDRLRGSRTLWLIVIPLKYAK